MGEVRRRPSLADLAIAATLAALGVVELHFDYAFDRSSEPGPVLLHYVVGVAIGGALAWRRTYPLIVAPFVQVLLGLQALFVALPNMYVPVIVLVIAIFSLAAYAPRLRQIAIPALVVTGFGILQGSLDPEDPVGSAVTMVIFEAIVLAAGVVVRRYRERTETMRHERDRAAAHALEVAAEERTRIARELHDVVAHGMSVVVLQARGGRTMLDLTIGDLGQARDAFDDIERVASECLDEMRRLLGILRSSADDAAPLAPQPKLGQLEQLVAQARASGEEVELVVEGERHELAPAIELAAYRIGQEALTNAFKHARGSRTRMTVRYEDSALAIEVEDDGPGSPNGNPIGEGHGLIGMRERVELYGGTLDAGTGPAGGFRLCARLPVARTPS
jgi:signal transduction histidine kinase